MDTILITGGSGFLGRNLIDFLLRKTNYKIISIYRSIPTQPFKSNKRLKNVYCDLRNRIDYQTIKEIGSVDHIIHLAGLTCAKKSFVEPVEAIDNNMVGTANLLEYVRHHVVNLKQFLYFSTAEIFGSNSLTSIFKEDDPPNSNSPYAATKIGAQELCIAYKNTFGIPVVITYAMNSFGPHQSSDKFIPLLIRKISKGEKVFIHLNKKIDIPLKRNYLHIEDICGAILFLLKNGTPGEKYNIAAQKECDNLMLAQTIAKLLEKKLNYELIVQDHNILVHPRLSGEKLWRLGWYETKTLEEGLKEFVEWTTKRKI